MPVDFGTSLQQAYLRGNIIDLKGASGNVIQIIRSSLSQSATIDVLSNGIVITSTRVELLGDLGTIKIGKTGDAYSLYLSANGISGISTLLDNQGVTTGVGVVCYTPNLVSGTCLKVTVDSDTVTTGKVIELMSGSAQTIPVFSVDKNGIIYIKNTVFAGAGTIKLDNAGEIDITCSALDFIPLVPSNVTIRLENSGIVAKSDTDLSTPYLLQLYGGPTSATNVFKVRADGEIVIGNELADTEAKVRLESPSVLVTRQTSIDMEEGYTQLWFRPPRMNTVTETAMVAGFGAGDNGKMWFNSNLSAFRGWDGAQVVTL